MFNCVRVSPDREQRQASPKKEDIMTYNFIIYKNGTTEKVYKDNTTSQGKKQAVENALKLSIDTGERNIMR